MWQQPPRRIILVEHQGLRRYSSRFLHPVQSIWSSYIRLESVSRTSLVTVFCLVFVQERKPQCQTLYQPKFVRKVKGHGSQATDVIGKVLGIGWLWKPQVHLIPVARGLR